jgi:hypothetical protein
MRSNDLYMFKNSFGDPCPKYDKYDMYKKKNQSILFIA